MFSLIYLFPTVSYAPREVILLFHMLTAQLLQLKPWKHELAFNCFPINYPKWGCTGTDLFQPLLCHFPADRLHTAVLRTPILLCTTGHLNSFSDCQWAPHMYHLQWTGLSNKGKCWKDWFSLYNTALSYKTIAVIILEAWDHDTWVLLCILPLGSSCGYYFCISTNVNPQE